jgi:cytosine/adenosine deaminase-related metal-dependent hydrolase
MAGTSSALAQGLRGSRRAFGRLARLPLLALLAFFACRERVELGRSDALAGAGGDAQGGAPAKPDEPEDAGQGGGVSEAGGAGPTGGGGAGEPQPRGPVLVSCEERPPPEACSLTGDASKGVRLIGTLLESLVTRQRGVLDIAPDGRIRCAACDCGDAQGALVIDCPDLVVSPGFINLHDHLAYSGTAPLAHPGELYEHRNDWRLGENGHEPLPFASGASTAEVLAQELRMLLGGATSIVGAGGRRGLLRNLDVPGLTEQLLPGEIRTEPFPLDDASGALDSAACLFGENPDTAADAETAHAYVPHIGEGNNQRAQDELRCALGSLDLLGENSAVIHAMALSRADAAELATRGTSVVWSPRSNLDLYGSTAPVALLGSLGVHIALGTDWLASGSMNLLRELDCARHYDDTVLGGYFGSFELWRMVTEHPAWALRLERQLGELRPGLVGDVAVFTATDGDAHASVTRASPANVRLVLRQGRPLYGDEQLISAFADAGCEALAVCGTDKRVCASETGLTLADIREAGEAVYPLFSCEVPASEPSCETALERECPAGETSCDPPPSLPDPQEQDADDDGISDGLDVCPRVADPEQTDADQDGRGDACDVCPLANSGLAACPLSIADLRAPQARLPLKSAVVIGTARVTALRVEGAKGFYVEDGDRAPYSGIFVYTDATTPGVSVGDQISLQGYFDHFQGTDELIATEVLTIAAGGSYAPLDVLLSDVADGSAKADELASLLVRVLNVEVELQNPDTPNDYDETQLLGGLRLDDLIFPTLDNTYVPGTRFTSITGISGFSFSHQKLYPRSLQDLVE